jgi:hypothetical protein
MSTQLLMILSMSSLDTSTWQDERTVGKGNKWRETLLDVLKKP